MNLEALTTQAGRAETLLKAIANRYRLMVLCELHQGELSVSALQQRIGLSQSALSQHLALMRAMGLVATRKEGLNVHYRIADARVFEMMRALEAIFCPQGKPKKR